MNKIDLSLDQPYILPTKEGQKLKDGLTAEIASHNAACDDLSEKIQKLRATDSAEWSARSETEAARLASKRAELLQAELDLRKRIGAFFARLRDIELPAAQEKAYQVHRQTTAEIRAAVEAIGYEDDEHGRVLSPVVERHPRVKAARIANDNLQGAEPHYAARRTNEAAIDRCQEKMAEIKNNAVGILR